MNTAGRSGGAIYYNQYPPTEANDTYSNNIAGVYGNNTASYGVQLQATFIPLLRHLYSAEYYYKEDYLSG